MNNNVKWHKANSPALNAGEVWVSSSGSKVTVVSVRKYPGAPPDANHSSDYAVTYEWKSQSGQIQQHEKDCWNFQVRYTHIADTQT